MTGSRRHRIQGMLLSTPTFNDDEYNLLLDRQRTHIRWLIEHGITGDVGVLLVAGGMGEGYFLDDDEWRSMADVLADEAGGKVATGIGVFELSARRAAAKAKYAAQVGLDCIQMAPPHYLLPTEEEIFQHYKYVNDASDVGIVAYNTPWAMPSPGYEFSQRLLERFVELENVVAIKWSTFDYKHFLRMIRLLGNRITFLDNNRILSHGARMGSRGFTDFFGNVAPRLSLKKAELLRNEQFDELDELDMTLEFDPLMRAVGPEEAPAGRMGEGPVGRMMLKALGMDTGPAFPAQVPQPPEAVAAFERYVQSSGLLEWVDWDQSILVGTEGASTPTAAD